MTLEKKSYGYWTEETILVDLKLVIEELGSFPTAKKLRIINREDLRTSIYRHGGLDYYRELLGYEIPQKFVSYSSEMSIICELKPIIKELGRFPLKRELIEMGKGNLANAMTKYGGFIRFRIIMKQILKSKTEH
ncbi:hypothetical protein KAU33_04600 [Candidatus Dependentiae bacterium]|nr:hypothetical protein [Candidatus Dependentiae bacterium]